MAALSAVLSCASMFAATATAQDIASAAAEPTSTLCRVYAIKVAKAQPSELRANCRGQGLRLGSATEFDAIGNESLQATLIDARVGNERRVLLLSIQGDGQPLVEDLSGQIALAAGRGPMSELVGVELDLKAFESTGHVGVRGRPEDLGSARTDRLDLGQQLAVERARQSNDAAQN